MFYLDSQRNLTRRDSSLVTSSRRCSQRYYDFDQASTNPQSTTRVTTSANESGYSLVTRTKGSIKKEIVTLLFESMLDCIIESWDVIIPPAKPEERMIIDKSSSETTTKKKQKMVVKSSKIKSAPKSQSGLELNDEVSQPGDPMQTVWWAGADEKAIIRFKNGNVYEGNISMKTMNGEGRFQWADGTVYLGQFKDNEIKGKGLLHWKDDTWYEGDFAGNIRHGSGLFVDSRSQRCYVGGWELGTKHGDGAMYYTADFKNSYDGEWINNVRHGYGIREYSQISGYEGEWDYYVRDGRGLMIWPNHDFYRGEWKNGTMSGDGIYTWNIYYNHTMSSPSLQIYRGRWLKGKRNGKGFLQIDIRFGTYYNGDFKDDKKHGSGLLVTCDGLIFTGKQLFTDDNMTPYGDDDDDKDSDLVRKLKSGPIEFDMCKANVGLKYHIEETIKNLDRQTEICESIICTYIEHNKPFDTDLAMISCNYKEYNINDRIPPYFLEFEETTLFKVTKGYEQKLNDIYLSYATICNTEDIEFFPILIRLYLWQFLYDCDINEKGLTFCEIDELFCQNPEWLIRTEHGPFEKVYYWQFLQSLICLANRLYAQKVLPGPKPDTISAKAFRFFMDNDALPNIGRCKGDLTQSFGSFVPIKHLYELYLSLGEPLSVRKFICAVRVPPHLYMDLPQPELIETPDENLLMGHNAFVSGDDMAYVKDNDVPDFYYCEDYFGGQNDLQLFNFGNLSCKAIINIIAKQLPQIYQDDYIIDLDAKMTFFEFYQTFIACAEESYKVKDEELLWRELFGTRKSA